MTSTNYCKYTLNEVERATRNLRWTEESTYHDLWEEMTIENNHWFTTRASKEYYDSSIYREFVEVRNRKPPKLPDSYPKGDLVDLLGVWEVDGL